MEHNRHGVTLEESGLTQGKRERQERQEEQKGQREEHRVCRTGAIMSKGTEVGYKLTVKNCHNFI